jgi:hypothetical protein
LRKLNKFGWAQRAGEYFESEALEVAVFIECG